MHAPRLVRLLHEAVVRPATHDPIGAAHTTMVGASNDLSHVVLESETVAGGTGVRGRAGVKHGDVLCESAGGELRLVNVGPVVNVCAAGRSASECGAGFGSGLYHRKRRPTVPSPRTAPGRSSPRRTPARTNMGVAKAKLAAGTQCKEHGAAPVNAPQLYMRVGRSHDRALRTRRSVRKTELGHAPTLYPAMYVGRFRRRDAGVLRDETELTAEAAELGLHDLELYEWRAKGVAGPGGVCARRTAA